MFQAEMNPFEWSLSLQASFRIQSLMFRHCTRYRCLKFKTGLLNISDQHLLKIKNYGVHNTSRMPLLDLLEYRRLPSLEGFQGSADFCYHKFKNVSKGGIHVNTQINLFKALLILAITAWSCL